MTTYGYARVSTTDQHLDAQHQQLADAGCTVIYQEKVSGSKAGSTRPQLAAMLAAAAAGDTVVVCKIDRIARSLRDLVNMVGDLMDKGVAFRVLNSPIDISSTVGNMTFQILGVIAEFERKLLLDRQKDGIDRARAEGKYKGKAATVTVGDTAEQVRAMLDMGFSKQRVADQTGVSLASVYRVARKGGVRC
jgi:DNA invertase Pin-like site-specific DNA recombinase